MTFQGWRIGWVTVSLCLAVLACEPQESGVEEPETAGGTMQPGIPPQEESGFGPAEQETGSTIEGEDVEIESPGEEVPGEETTSQPSTVEFRVEYAGEVEGDLLMTLFAEWPP